MDNLYSIIMPAYNAEKYIEKAIKSVINQSYKKWELIIVDDGSNDNTIKIIQKYVSTDKRIKLFQNPKKGAGAARNYGILNSKGKYIAFIDSDDYYSPNFISVANQLINKGSDCVIFDYVTVIDGKENGIKRTGTSPYNSFTACWNKVYSKKIWDGIFFDEKNKIEDLQIIPILVFRAKNVMHAPNNVYYYYLYNDNSVTKSETIEESRKIIDAINQLLNNMKLYKMPFNLLAANFINQLIIPHLLRGIKNGSSNKSKKELYLEITKYLHSINTKYFGLNTVFYCSNKVKRLRTKLILFLLKNHLYALGIKVLELSWTVGGMLSK